MVREIKIHVVDRDGRFEADPTVPVNTTMRAFIKSMGKKFNLPQEGSIKSGKLKGQYRYYQAINKRTGQILRGGEEEERDPRAAKRGLTKTFADYDVRDEDVIKITEIIVGGADRKRLEGDYKALKKIEKQAKEYITLKSSGDPPDFYEVEVEGIQGIERIENNEPVIRTNHKFTIDLKGDYPVDKPEIRFMTPIFHPYMYVDNKVCVTDGWSPAFPLGELFVEIIDRIQCESPIFPKNVAIPANSTAHKWYMLYKNKIQEVIETIPFPPSNTESEFLDNPGGIDEEGKGIKW